VVIEKVRGPEKEKSMDKRSNRERAEKAFRDWQDGTG
jgi:hypothetical protein